MGSRALLRLGGGDTDEDILIVGCNLSLLLMKVLQTRWSGRLVQSLDR